MDMKFLEKVAANRFDLFVVMKKTKQTNKQNSTTFRTYWHQGHTGTLHMVSEQRVQRSDPMDSSTHRYAVNKVI